MVGGDCSIGYCPLSSQVSCNIMEVLYINQDIGSKHVSSD